MADREQLIARLRVASGLAEAPEIAPTQWAGPLQEAADLLERDAAVCEERDRLAAAVKEVMPILNMDGERHPKLEAALQQADSGEVGEDRG